MNSSLERLAYEVLEQHLRNFDLALVGIQRRGVHLARRIQGHLQRRLGEEVPLGKLDINLYRDDWTRIGAQPVVRKSEISFNIDEKHIILIDDVLFTGRTVRAAMDALMDFGRPARIELAVLIDRGHRELPIQANYIGKYIKTRADEAINVRLSECDGADRVDLISNGA